MTLLRRTFVRLAAGAVAIPGHLAFRMGAAYPSRPVRIVVGFAPGSAADIVARLLGRSLSERLGRNLSSITNQASAAIIATEMVVNAAPGRPHAADGSARRARSMRRSTRSSASISAATSRRSPPSCGPRTSWWSVVGCRPTVPEFIALAKANPGRLTMASAGVGTASHLAGELFKMTTGVEMVHVAYRGGAGAYADLIDGRVDVYFPPLISARELRQERRAAGLGGGGFVPGYEASDLVRRRRSQEHPLRRRRPAQRGDQRGLRRSRRRGTDRRWRRHGASPARRRDFGKLIADETAKWAKA